MKASLLLGTVAFALVLHTIPASAEPIPSNVLRCVSYLTIPNPESKPEAFKPNILVGTGFFIGYIYPEKLDRQYVFLVTARHVLFDNKKQQHAKMFVRLNSKTEGVAHDLGPIPKDAWIVSSDPAVDLAIIPLLPREADFLSVPSSMFLSDEVVRSQQVGLGDEVFYVGMLPYHSGIGKITPIARFGRLALVTDEKTTDGHYYHFIDAGNYPGHSGSPVFLWASPSRSSSGLVVGPRIFKLYGVVSGVIEYAQELKWTKPSATIPGPVPVDIRTGGVTTVVPIRYLDAMLRSDRARTASGTGPATGSK